MILLKIKKANSLRRKFVGLIGQEKAFPLLIKTRFGIHTFGLKFPIDVLILNKNCQVAALKENLSVNRIFIWNPFFDTVLELPKGTIQKEKIKLHDHIKLEF